MREHPTGIEGVDLSTEAIEVTPELKRGRNQLAATVVVGHAVKHIYNSALQSILFPEIKIGLGA